MLKIGACLECRNIWLGGASFLCLGACSLLASIPQLFIAAGIRAAKENNTRTKYGIFATHIAVGLGSLVLAFLPKRKKDIADSGEHTHTEVVKEMEETVLIIPVKVSEHLQRKVKNWGLLLQVLNGLDLITAGSLGIYAIFRGVPLENLSEYSMRAFAAVKILPCIRSIADETYHDWALESQSSNVSVDREAIEAAVARTFASNIDLLKAPQSTHIRPMLFQRA